MTFAEEYDCREHVQLLLEEEDDLPEQTMPEDNKVNYIKEKDLQKVYWKMNKMLKPKPF